VVITRDLPASEHLPLGFTLLPLMASVKARDRLACSWQSIVFIDTS